MMNLRRDAKVKFRMGVLAMTVAGSGLCVAIGGLGGCTQNSSNEWAQTAPVIKADATTGDGMVSLGAKK